MKAIALIFGAVLLRFLIVSPFMLLFWWVHRSTKKLRPRENGTSVEFSLAPRMHILIEIVTVSLITFTALIVWHTVREGEGLYAALIPVSVLAAIFFAEPRTVLINHEGIRQRRWLRRDRVIAWNEIAWMRRGRNTGTTYVKSRSGGRPVSFSPLLVGQSRFEREVRKHTHATDLDSAGLAAFPRRETYKSISPIGFAAMPHAANLNGVGFRTDEKEAVVAYAQPKFVSSLQGFHVTRA